MKKLRRFKLFNANVNQNDIIRKHLQKYIIGGYVPLEECVPPVIHPDCQKWKSCTLYDEHNEYVDTLYEYGLSCSDMHEWCNRAYEQLGWRCSCCTVLA